MKEEPSCLEAALCRSLSPDSWLHQILHWYALRNKESVLDHINLGSMDLTSQSSVKEKSIVLYWRALGSTRSSAIISLVFVNIEFHF